MSRMYHSHVMNTILSDKTRQIHVRIFPRKAQISSHFPGNPFFLTCYLSRLHIMMPVKQNAHKCESQNSSIVPQITKLVENSSIVPQITNLSKIRQSFLKLQTCRNRLRNTGLNFPPCLKAFF